MHEMSPLVPHPGRATGLRLWCLRHAEVHESWRGRAYGDLDVPLSEEGRAATLALAREFVGARVDLVLASPLARARELGEVLAAAAGAPLEVRDGLRELHRGAWQGLPVDELNERFPEDVAAYYADPWSFAGHGGEPDEAILARALPAVDEALRRAPGGTVVLATHYNVIRVLAARLLGLEPARSFAFRVDPGRGALFLDGPDGWYLRASNVERPSAAGTLEAEWEARL